MRLSRNYLICLILARPSTITVITISLSHSPRALLLTQQVILFMGDADVSVHTREEIISDAVAVSS